MDLTTITLAQLQEARPDLVEALQTASTVQQELAAIKEERDKLARELAQLKARQELAQELKEAGLSESDLPAGMLPVLEALAAPQRQPLLKDLAQRLKRPTTQPVAASAAQSVPPGDFLSRTKAWKA